MHFIFHRATVSVDNVFFFVLFVCLFLYIVICKLNFVLCHLITVTLSFLYGVNCRLHLVQRTPNGQ